jgi:hypothetical protein
MEHGFLYGSVWREHGLNTDFWGQKHGFSYGFFWAEHGLNTDFFRRNTDFLNLFLATLMVSHI